MTTIIDARSFTATRSDQLSVEKRNYKTIRTKESILEITMSKLDPYENFGTYIECNLLLYLIYIRG